jgi:molybdate transport system substrate-binding protein
MGFNPIEDRYISNQSSRCACFVCSGRAVPDHWLNCLVLCFLVGESLMFRSLYCFWVMALLSAGSVSPAFADTTSVTVFAAASLKEVLEEAGRAFTASGGPEIIFSFAASSALAKQIENGAPADVFASADLKWMDYLAEKKLIRTDSRVDFLGNTLVLVAPRTSSLTSVAFTSQSLADALGRGRISLGEVNSVPAGIYAKEAFQKLDLWSGIENMTAQAENVRSALVFVARGEVPLGAVYATDAKAEPNVKVVALFPQNSHQPIVYPFAITANAKGNNAAGFLDFLRGQSARVIFERAGFPVLVN